MSYYDDVMSEIYGDNWEQYICPIKGPAGSDLCYVDRDSEECQKCQEDFLKFCEEMDKEVPTSGQSGKDKK